MQQEQSQKIEEKIQSMTSEEVKPFSTQTKEPFTEYVSYDLSNANNFNYQQNILFQQEQWYQRGQHGNRVHQRWGTRGRNRGRGQKRNFQQFHSNEVFSQRQTKNEIASESAEEERKYSRKDDVNPYYKPSFLEDPWRSLTKTSF